MLLTPCERSNYHTCSFALENLTDNFVHYHSAYLTSDEDLHLWRHIRSNDFTTGIYTSQFMSILLIVQAVQKLPGRLRIHRLALPIQCSALCSAVTDVYTGTGVLPKCQHSSAQKHFRCADVFTEPEVRNGR